MIAVQELMENVVPSFPQDFGEGRVEGKDRHFSLSWRLFFSNLVRTWDDLIYWDRLPSAGFYLFKQATPGNSMTAHWCIMEQLHPHLCKLVFIVEEVVEEERKNDTYRLGEMRKKPLGLSDERVEGHQAGRRGDGWR